MDFFSLLVGNIDIFHPLGTGHLLLPRHLLFFLLIPHFHFILIGVKEFLIFHSLFHEKLPKDRECSHPMFVENREFFSVGNKVFPRDFLPSLILPFFLWV